ncbi:metallophosphoesterase [Methylocella silvestris]|uniref:metallophosphoesterase n=1 Tax=Methylocella silvestris TaxID=199596 RepID=UPI0015E06615|nr:metallophosphoesterase [Methylocella silvestris]
MTRISRRLFLQTAGGAAWATTGFGSYAFAFEPGFRLQVTPYHVDPPGWPADLQLRAVLIADIHACEPFMSAARIRSIAELANALQPDIVFLLGDYSGGHNFVTGPVMPDQWGEALSILNAPLGAYAVLGNHDWLHGPLPSMPADDAAGVRSALAAAHIKVLENDAVRLAKDGHPFWVAGLGDQVAGPAGHSGGVDDLPGTLSKITDAAPAIMLAHEPFVFKRMPDRVALTLSGHTHGGQVNIAFVQDRYARVFKDLVYGHIVENNRHLIISGGLGTSHAPIRFMRPPELVEVTIGRAPLGAGS